MVWQGIDNRRFPRIEYPCMVIVLRSDIKNTFSTHTENLGVGGMCIVIPKELPRFCLVDVLLYLQSEPTPIECSGRAVWVVKKEKKFDIGIEFIDLRETDRLKIERIVQKWLLQQEE